MLAHADAALYAAKRAGRGQVLLWRPDMAGE
jgi:PleD family two-component response regulator